MPATFTGCRCDPLKGVEVRTVDWALWSIAPAWEHVDLLTLRQAACLLSDMEPPVRNRVLPANAAVMLEVLEQAVLLGSLSPFAAFTWDNVEWNAEQPDPIDTSLISPHTRLADQTKIRAKNLAAWCDAKGITHPWAEAFARTQQPTQQLDSYPAELRAAIEAFEAVRSDPKAQAGHSPKSAIAAWLKSNKPDLSEGARDRIATVANWQPVGGAPKTPGT
ncbi:hypothetical protein [Metallibacterium scheffleri]|jgi:hypothetical protein|uniref:hypothetical protein n=1 Tax=Metallibacterium scheffleri TaxID=993689 RepID=UPI0023F3142A|nr:hypothetical protein [Metallibacterium scheffleri]